MVHPPEPSTRSSFYGDDDEDCIVWGETGNTSVRKEDSPSFETPRSDEDDSATPKKRSRASLDNVAGRILPSSSEQKKREEKSELEINMMWSRLQQQNLNLETTTEYSDTPLRKNQSDSSATAAPVTNTAPQENRWGLVKSRRRRDRQQRSHRLADLNAPSSPEQDQQSKAVNDYKNKSKRRKSADDAFAALVEHLKTPERTDDSSMPPPTKTQKSLSSSPIKTLKSTSVTPMETTIKHNQNAKEESPDPFGPFPDIDFEALDRSIVLTQANLSQKMSDAKVLDPTPTTLLQPQQPPPHQPFHRQHQVANDHKTVVNNHISIDQHQQKQSTKFPRVTDKQASAALNEAVQSTMPVQRPSVARPPNEVEDDPFGDLPMIDMDLVEKSIQQATQAKVPQPAPAPQEDDPFGDFPDLDFEAIDQQIAAATQPTSRDDKLSRYRVVHVLNDANTYTKILHVARWQDEMYIEFEDRIAIHRERSGAFPTPKQWVVDGVLHLQGEWYHTEAEEGDFLHVYSLFGRASTSQLPLTLDTRANPAIDDLVLIMHPETLLVPTTISETMKCTRRAVLKNRLGSSGGSSKSKLFIHR